VQSFKVWPRGEYACLGYLPYWSVGKVFPHAWKLHEKKRACDMVMVIYTARGETMQMFYYLQRRSGSWFGWLLQKSRHFTLFSDQKATIPPAISELRTWGILLQNAQQWPQKYMCRPLATISPLPKSKATRHAPLHALRLIYTI
jgi:hypothetical protein